MPDRIWDCLPCNNSHSDLGISLTRKPPKTQPVMLPALIFVHLPVWPDIITGSPVSSSTATVDPSLSVVITLPLASGSCRTFNPPFASTNLSAAVTAERPTKAVTIKAEQIDFPTLFMRASALALPVVKSVALITCPHGNGNP